MATNFTLTSKTRVDAFQDEVSIGDATNYQFDCKPWQEDNDTITSVTWNVEHGQASISGQTITSGVLSALVSFPQSGRLLISLLLSTASGQSKKIWLEIYVKDKTGSADDYGLH